MLWAKFKLVIFSARARTLMQDDFDAFCIEHKYPDGVARALKILFDADLLTSEDGQKNFGAVIGHAYPRSVAGALKILFDAGLLTPEGGQANFDAVIGHKNPYGAAYALKILFDASLLKPEDRQANRNAVIGHAYPWYIADTLKSLFHNGLLTQDNFVSLLSSPCLSSKDARLAVWHRIPQHLFTPAVFNQLIIHAQQANPAQMVRQYVDQLSGIRSTPTPAINQCLLEYIKKITATKTIQETKDLIDQLTQEGITEDVWEIIKPEVSARIKDEFMEGEIAGGLSEARLDEIIADGMWAGIETALAGAGEILGERCRRTFSEMDSGRDLIAEHRRFTFFAEKARKSIIENALEKCAAGNSDSQRFIDRNFGIVLCGG